MTRSHRMLITAGAVAGSLAVGPAMAADQSASTEGQTGDVGRASLPSPEWQFYAKELDPRYGVLAWLTFDEVLGSQVADQQGQAIGEIVHLVRAKADGMFYAVMDVDDAWEDIDQAVVVPVGQLKVVGDEESPQIVYAGQDPIGTMPAYDAADHDMARSAE